MSERASTAEFERSTPRLVEPDPADVTQLAIALDLARRARGIGDEKARIEPPRPPRRRNRPGDDVEQVEGRREATIEEAGPALVDRSRRLAGERTREKQAGLLERFANRRYRQRPGARGRRREAQLGIDIRAQPARNRHMGVGAIDPPTRARARLMVFLN